MGQGGDAEVSSWQPVAAASSCRTVTTSGGRPIGADLSEDEVEDGGAPKPLSAWFFMEQTAHWALALREAFGSSPGFALMLPLLKLVNDTFRILSPTGGCFEASVRHVCTPVRSSNCLAAISTVPNGLLSLLAGIELAERFVAVSPFVRSKGCDFLLSDDNSNPAISGPEIQAWYISTDCQWSKRRTATKRQLRKCA